MPTMIRQYEDKMSKGEQYPTGGVVVNVASVQGLMSQPDVPAYGMSKGAILSLTRSMACDYGKYGIRVNAINPGTVREHCA